MPGWGPFVEETKYQAFIADYVDQPEVSAFFSFQFSNTNSLARSICVSLSTTLLSGLRHGAHPVMLCQERVLSFALGMHWYEGTALATCRKAKSKCIHEE